MAGFTVVQQALIDAANGVTDAAAGVKARPIDKIDPSTSHIGHHDLASAWSGFTDRWTIGINHLLNDGDEFATRLNQAASTYLGMDTEVASLFEQIGGGP